MTVTIFLFVVAGVVGFTLGMIFGGILTMRVLVKYGDATWGELDRAFGRAADNRGGDQ